MKRVQVPSYPVSIFIAGNYDMATAICSRFCNAIGLCVTITPTRYVYTGGCEEGVVVSLINYPRFPAEPHEIFGMAERLARYLREELHQQESFTLQAPDKTVWFSWRAEDNALAGKAGTAATVKQGAVYEHATAQPERPTVPAILPNKERP